MTTFIDNFAAFLPKTGYENGHVAWWLAGVPWPSTQARDDFIHTLDQT